MAAGSKNNINDIVHPPGGIGEAGRDNEAGPQNRRCPRVPGTGPTAKTGIHSIEATTDQFRDDVPPHWKRRA